MPSFYAPGYGLPSHGLPTPPERIYGDEAHYKSGFFAFPPRYHQNGCEFIEQYSQSLKPNPLYPHPPIEHGMYANSLPPIRTNVQLPPMGSSIPQQYRRQDIAPMQQEQPKEEKATGGVATYLDYDMERMSDFVAEMAQGMYALYNTKITLSDIDFARSIAPGSSTPPQFRKYVYQILSSTRLPSSTILLALFYLSLRMRLLSSQRVFKNGTSQIYRMLTVSLILGSKFLDDNTFQNKSWSEVSNIPVAELNKMELEWLFAFDWKLHTRMYAEDDGYNSWRRRWESWRAKANLRAQESRQTLAPIKTNLVRPHQAPVVSKAPLSPEGEGPIPPQYQRNENSWLNPAASEYSPPSAAYTGPSTPVYYPALSYQNPPPPYSHSWMPQTHYLPQQSVPRSQPPSYPPHPVVAAHSIIPECVDWSWILVRMPLLF
ncbi:hypothetical protein N7495_008158 [Penicillium taxi]|uniref:uncharacterized protein n=1 Tax=Penicillium taxi TaxID=168475 RepID=UPI0025456ABE|nr:uncharacterized protein N7495_008158 [Penicillium taxi]KAJ5888117.1 hypothetical protein N7495_008158 [Penicillium taxi]